MCVREGGEGGELTLRHHRRNGGILAHQRIERGLVLEEQHGAVGGTETRDAGRQRGVGGLGHGLLQARVGNVPQLLVLGLDQHHGARRLHVERRRRVLDRRVHDLLDPAVRDGRLVGQCVAGEARFDGGEEGVGVGGHGGLI